MRMIQTLSGEVPALHDYPEGRLSGGEREYVLPTGKPGTKAFIEYSPVSGGFIRIDAETLEEADRRCWEQFQRETACPHTAYESRGYKNGLGFCLACGHLASEHFSAADLQQFCHVCGDPTYGPHDGGLYFRDTNEFECEKHNSLADYQDFMFFLNWEYDGKLFEDSSFTADRKELLKITWQKRAPDAELLQRMKAAVDDEGK